MTGILIRFEELTDIVDKPIEPTREELIDCIKNLMGTFDTPFARLKYTSRFIESVREESKEIMKKISGFVCKECEENKVEKQGMVCNRCDSYREQ